MGQGFTGLVARGNVVVDAWWDAGRLTRAHVTPRLAGDLVLVTGPGFGLQLDGGRVVGDENGRFSVHLLNGVTYLIERNEPPI